MNVILIPPSDRELEEAISYYNTQQEKLGERFYQEFLRTLRYILIAPDSWRKVGTNTREPTSEISHTSCSIYMSPMRY